jgi:hypothetical protein
MQNQPLALVLIAQAAINLIASRWASNTRNTDIIHGVQPFGVSSAINPAGLIFKEGFEKRQPNGNQSDVESQKEERT